MADEVIILIKNETDHRIIEMHNSNQPINEALTKSTQRTSGNRNMDMSKVECFNCHKQGHFQQDCWSKGGGQEGRGPHGKCTF